MAYMLSTVDNPFDPRTQFDHWLSYDLKAGYNTCGVLDRMIGNFDQVSQNSFDDRLEEAINSIVSKLPEFYIKLEI